MVDCGRRPALTYEELLGPQFNILDVPGDDLDYVSECILTIYFAVTKIGADSLDVDWEQVRRFVRKVAEHYRIQNQYHTFFHAFCVIRETAYLFRYSGGDGVRSSKGLFAVLTAALIHDINHPGTNNDYEIKTNSQLAQHYKDAGSGILECHHHDFAMSLLRQEEYDVFHLWPEELRLKMEEVIRDAVLATDMAQHKPMTEELQRRSALPKPFDFSLLDERIVYIKFILHAADIFNAARPFPVCQKIAEQVVAEFMAQVELERSQGLPSAPFMIIEDELTFCKSEKGFAQFVALPYFSALAACFPDKEALGQIVAQINSNIESWQQKIDALAPDAVAP